MRYLEVPSAFILILASTDMEVRRKAIKIALSMVTSRNVQDVVLFLKKQLTKTLEQEYEKVRRH